MILSPQRIQTPRQVVLLFLKQNLNISLEAKRGQDYKEMLGPLFKVTQSVRPEFIT